MAEHLLRARGVEAVSAGTDVAVVAEPMAGHALVCLQDKGIDGSGHRAQRLTAELLDADLVLAMTAKHSDAVLALRPEARVVVLDVPDPYGGSLADYRACCEALEVRLRELVPRSSARPGTRTGRRSGRSCATSCARGRPTATTGT
jgi:protein-tyrosine-phosphatase